jgi:uncharacterized protein
MERPVYRTPEELFLLTQVKKRETRRFLSHLQKTKPANLDTSVHALHQEAFSSFSCLDCANCCKTIGPRLLPKDIERLARFLKIKVTDFYTRYIMADEDGDLVFAGHPCPFLQPDNFCSVYLHRPKACREYPHTDRKRFHQILDLTHKNCEICPVVFDITTELKARFRFPG